MPLSGYRGRDIRFGFYTVSVTNGKTLFDNIRIGSLPDNDLAATDVRLPRRMPARSETTVTVGVGNYGGRRAEAWSVGLYRNGALVQTVAGPALDAGAETTVSFREMPGIFSGDTVSYHAVIDCAGDGDLTNNATATARTVVLLPESPAVADLACRRTSGGVVLTWGEPGAAGVTSGAITDDFEAYEAFAADEAGRWMFIDGDGVVTYQFSAADYPNASEPKAYIVMASLSKLNIGPYSGKQCMAAFPASEGRNDDWMISPELDGKAQTVSFFVKSVAPNSDKSTCQFYYSMGGVDRDDFIMVGEEVSAPYNWSEQRFDVPAGAAYFAIRCTSSGRSVFFVDDVTYVPASSAPLGLVGYNVYRDGALLNAGPVPEPGYTDSAAGGGEHEYFVTVVYDRGESRPSNVVTTGTAGLIAGSVMPHGFGLSATDGAIVISGADGHHVTVSTLAGRRVYSGAGTASMRLGVGSGVYIVRVGAAVMKIVVR